MLTNKKIIVAAVLVFCMLFCCAFSFAAFSSELSASGVVAGEGSFDVDFYGYAVNDTITPNGGATENVTITVTALSDDSISLGISVPSGFSSKSVTFPVTVINRGTVKATAQVNSATTSPFTLKTTESVVVAPDNGTKTFNVTLTAASGLAGGRQYSTVTLNLDFVQPEVSGISAQHSN